MTSQKREQKTNNKNEFKNEDQFAEATPAQFN